MSTRAHTSPFRGKDDMTPFAFAIVILFLAAAIGILVVGVIILSHIKSPPMHDSPAFSLYYNE